MSSSLPKISLRLKAIKVSRTGGIKIYSDKELFVLKLCRCSRIFLGLDFSAELSKQEKSKVILVRVIRGLRDLSRERINAGIPPRDQNIYILLSEHLFI